MAWEIIPVLLLFIVAGAISAFFTLIFWKNRAITLGAIPITVAMAAVTLWTGSSAIRLLGNDPALVFIGQIIEIITLGIIPVAVFIFALQYSGRIHRSFNPASWILLLIVPAAMGTILLLSAGDLSEQVPLGDSLLAPFFWISLLYNLFLMLCGVGIIIQCYQSPVRIFNGQLACLLIAILAPFFLHFAYVFRINPFAIIDLAPIGCIVTVVALATGIERYSLFDVIPIEQGTVIRQAPAGIVVLDAAGRIIEINPPALRMLGIRSQDVIGEQVSTYLPPRETPLPTQPENGFLGRRYLIQREIDGVTCHIEIRCIPLLSRQAERQGHLMVLSDITDQKLTELSLNLARRNVNLLTAITRHDILNQLTVIILHNEILRESAGDPDQVKSLLEQDKAAKNIRRIIAFTKDYEKLGENLPEWLDIETIFSRLVESLGYDYIHFSVHAEGLEIFADPLIGRVFENLLDNSLRYGQKVTHIRFYTNQHLDGLTLIYEDNGIGIPAGEKMRIFQRGTGRNTGFGLFFAKEILSITGITIRETGQEGSGARFEIMVPWGRFRYRREGNGAGAGKQS
jgi:PAS domain S-box-containing protein